MLLRMSFVTLNSSLQNCSGVIMYNLHIYMVSADVKPLVSQP